MATHRKTIAKNPLMNLKKNPLDAQKKVALTSRKAVVKKKAGTVKVSDSGKASTKKKVTFPSSSVAKSEKIATRIKKAAITPRKKALPKTATEISMFDNDPEGIWPKQDTEAKSANEIFDAELSSSPKSLKRAIVVTTNRLDRGQQIVNKWSKVSLLTIVLPNTVLEYIVISGIQLKMLRDMSQLYGIPFKADAFKVILGSILGGSVAYFLSDFYSGLVKSVPFVGKPIAFLTEPAIAYVTTYAVGFVFLEHFERQGSFDNIDLGQMKISIKNKIAEKYQELLKKKNISGKGDDSGFEKVSV